MYPNMLSGQRVSNMAVLSVCFVALIVSASLGQEQQTSGQSPGHIPIFKNPVGQNFSQPVGQTFRKPDGQTFRQPVGQTFRQPGGQTFGQTFRQPVRQTFRQPVGQTFRKPVGQPVGQTFRQPVRQTFRQPGGQTFRQPFGQTFRQPVGQTFRQPVAQTFRQTFRQPVRQTFRQPGGQTFRQPVRQPVGQTFRQPIRQTFRQTTETAKDALDEAVYQATIGIADCDLSAPSRRKRSAPLPYAGEDYDVPYGEYAKHTPWSYLPLPGFSLYPGLVRTSAFNLPSQRFFTSFTAPVRIVRTAAGNVLRYYYKSGTYEHAYNDFMSLPLTRHERVGGVGSSAVQQVVVRAVTTSWPGYTFQLCSHCCRDSPCISSHVTGAAPRDRRVARFYVYLA